MQRFLSWKSLRTERGEIPASIPSTPTDGAASPDSGAAAPDGGATGGGAAPAPASFFDPSALPDELKPQWSSMHRAYTKKLEEVKGVKDRAAQVDRFYTDADYAKQVVMERAQQLGLTLNAAGPSPQSPQVSSELVELAKQHLSPELHWMAPQHAAATMAILDRVLGPDKAAQKAKEQTSRQRAYQDASKELSGKAPAWAEHESEMLEVLEFIRSEETRHPRFGNKLEMLYNLATGNAAAVQAATQRMSAAGQARTSTGQSARSVIPNYESKIREAKNTREAFALAAKAAEEELTRTGQ